MQNDSSQVFKEEIDLKFNEKQNKLKINKTIDTQKEQKKLHKNSRINKQITQI